MNPTSVSIIIPAGNAAATLAQALDSVAAQTWPADEIIGVDDASTDATAAVFEAWRVRARSPARVRLIRQPRNTGPAGARNTGVRAATGEWIAFLDADDAWLPHRLDAQFRVAAARPGVALFCGRTVPLEAVVPPPPDPAFRLMPLRLETFMIHNPVATSTVLVRRRVLEAAGLFDEQFRGPEDYDLWMRIAAGHECLYLDVALSRYRTTAGSLSMDDRTFLPQVTAVLHKAFAAGGALHAFRHGYRRACAEQLASASWMAWHRRDRLAALRHLLRSWLYSPVPLHKERTQDPLLRVKLLFLYLRPDKRPPRVPLPATPPEPPGKGAS